MLRCRISGGGYVSKLPKEAFRSEETACRRPLPRFRTPTSPWKRGSLWTPAAVCAAGATDVNAAGLAFIEKSNPQDQIFVINFNDTVKEGLPESVPFTDRIGLLRMALSTGIPEGRTVLYDAIAAGLRHLEKGNRDKKTLVLVTDGGDNRSQIDLEEIMRMIVESHTTIYTVGIFDPERSLQQAGRLAANCGDERRRIRSCQKLPPQVVPICEKIAKDIRNRYTLGYVPSRGAGPGVRKIKVTATAPDRGRLIVTSRTSYKLPDNTAAK